MYLSQAVFGNVETAVKHVIRRQNLSQLPERVLFNPMKPFSF